MAQLGADPKIRVKTLAPSPPTLPPPPASSLSPTRAAPPSLPRRAATSPLPLSAPAILSPAVGAAHFPLLQAAPPPSPPTHGTTMMAFPLHRVRRRHHPLSSTHIVSPLC